MFTAQIILLAATAVAPLASNAAPILSGMFSHSRRADSNVQLAQGTNFFFSNLHLEAQCTPGQVACVSGNLATCSGEANWEITPCTGNTACFATPNADNTNINVQCMAESDADAAIAQAGGQGGVSVDFQVTDAPFPDPNSPTPTDAPTDEPTSTDDGAVATETCIPEDGSEGSDGSDGSDGSEDGSDGSNNEDPFPTGTVVEEPTITDTPTESCNADEPEQTETVTLILVPNPTEPGSYETVTFSGEFPAATETESASFGVGLGPGVAITDVPTDAAPTDATPTDAAATEATPTETCTDSEGGDAEYTDAPLPTETEPAPGTPTSSSGVVNVVGTHVIPSAPTKRSINPFRFVKVRRS